LFLDLRRNLSLEIRHIDSKVTGEGKFIVPYHRNPYFKGRSEFLTKLHNKLCETVPDNYNHRVALYGLGGVGKTQLALEYVHTHWQRKTYERVYWVSAVNQATLWAGLQEIGVQTHCVAVGTNPNPSQVAATVLRWLNEQDKWLLVIDNLDDVTVVDGYLPDAAPERHTLITTRNQHCDDIPAEGLEVGVLDVAEAMQLLLTRAKVGSVGETSEGKDEAAKIVKELGFLPLAIEQAAAYIREASHDIFQFLPGYLNDRKFYHARTSKGNRMYSNSLATTWHLSFQQVQKNSNDAAELLKLLAFLNPDGVLIEFLERGREGLTPELQALVTDRKKLYDALAELTRFSLIGRQDEGSPRITIHRLVQSIIQDDMSSVHFSAMTTTVAGLCESGFPTNRTQYWMEETLELRQLGRKYQDQVFLPLRTLGHIASPRMAKVMQRVGAFLLEDGNYQQAEEFGAKAVTMMKVLNGAEHHSTLVATALVAAACWQQGKWDLAQKLDEDVLEVRERLFGQEHPYTLWAMGNLAATYRNQGKWDLAEKLEENVLEVRERLFGQEHPDTLWAMENLAATYRERGNWDLAQKLEENVLEVRERLLGQEHPDTLWAMENLAATYREQGKWVRAQKLEKNVLEARVGLLGPEHPDTLRIMANLGYTYGCLGAISTSIEFLETAVAKQNRILGHEHFHALRTRRYLALSYEKDGRLGPAIALLEETLEVQTRILGELHPQTRYTLAALESCKRKERYVLEISPSIISS
jgi:tetratricopeptide (TPR) repeat protein